MSTLSYARPKKIIGTWEGSEADILTDPIEINNTLRDLSSDSYLLDFKGQIGITTSGIFKTGKISSDGIAAVAMLSAISPSQFGDAEFISSHGLRSAYMAGSMANGISGIDLVTALGKVGYLASFGSGGVSPARLLDAISSIKNQLPDGPFAFNLIHSPNEPVLEQKAVDLFLEHGIQTIEASAFLRLTPTVVQFRAAGLSSDSSGKLKIQNKIIAKLSRPEVAIQFLNPAPEKILAQLVEGYYR